VKRGPKDNISAQDLSKEQAETHKVLVQPALEAAANATTAVLQQLIKSITEQVKFTTNTACLHSSTCRS